MARSLTPGQKAILKKYPATCLWEDLPLEEQEKVLNLNDYETVLQDADRFLGDQYFRAQR